MNFLTNQLSEIADLFNAAVFLSGSFCTYILFFAIYRGQGKEFFDGKQSSFETAFAKKLLWYLPWALIQQIIVLLPMSYFDREPFIQYGASVGVFALLYHFPNWRLILFTGIFGAVFYGAWYFAGFTSLLWLSALHAFAGCCYHFLGWDMRVWRFK